VQENYRTRILKSKNIKLQKQEEHK